MGGKSKTPEPTVTRASTKTGGQQDLLTNLLSMMGNYMGPESFGSMPTLGERYGGGRTGRAGGPSPGAGGKGGTTPGGSGGMAFGGERPRPEGLEGLPMIRPAGQGVQGTGGTLQRGLPPSMSPENRQMLLEKMMATGGGGMGREQRRRPRGSALDEVLAGPIINPFREGMTGNYPKRGRR